MVKMASNTKLIERYYINGDWFGVTFNNTMNFGVQCCANRNVHTMAKLAVWEVWGLGRGSANQFWALVPFI